MKPRGTRPAGLAPNFFRAFLLFPMPSQRAALALLILVEAAAFAYMSETVIVPVAVAVAVLLGVRGARRYRMSQDRQVISSLVLALLFVAKWRVQPYVQSDDMMPYLSPFLHSLGQYLLVLQTAALYLAHDRDVLPLTLPWPGVFVMVAAGDITVLPPQRFAFQLLSMAFVAATALFFAATARASSGIDRRPYGVTKTAVCLLLLIGTAGIAWAASSTLHRYETRLDELVAELLTPEPAAGAGFPSRSRLGSIAQRKSERANDIALRVYSASEPGYLRGKAYHWLKSIRGASGSTTQWEEAPDPGDGPVEGAAVTLTPVSRDGQRAVFRLRSDQAPPSSAEAPLDVWLETPQNVYFLPPLAAEIITNEPALRQDYRHVIGETDGAVATYAVRTAPPPDTSPFFNLSQDTGAFSRSALTQVPEATASHDIVGETADQIFKDCVSVEDHVAAVENYFRSTYGYAIGIDVPRDRDPVVWFLQTKPNAHCEFFAQAAALLLRTRGIPTRYMTGFVVAERNEYGGYWLARNEHAHAWCEAWDDRRGWVIVEATPSAGVPSEAIAPWHRQLWEYLSGAVAEFRHRFAEGGWLWLFRRLASFLFSPAGVAALLLLIGYVALRLKMRRKTLVAPPQSSTLVEMRRLLRRMDRHLAKVGLVRRRGETLTRFASRVRAETADPAAAAWYESYAETRYGERLDAEAVTALKTRLRSLKPSLLKSPLPSRRTLSPLPGERGKG